MKKMMENQLFILWLRLTQAAMPFLLVAGMAWLREDLRKTFLTRTEADAIHSHQELKTQLLLADMNKNMSLLGQAVNDTARIMKRNQDNQ